ncbi:hypothetical protein Fmac_019080 [Flemingia macrophylla]|uniref:Uncharacterized protein n=1 Tax=Flemingia macrophylla TaxID=520843 RepID=A0ABD1M6U0_9FABA
MEATAKNEGKLSLLMRLRPESVVHHNGKSLQPKSNAIDPVLSYMAIANKNGAVLPAILSSLIRGGPPENRGQQCRRKNNTWLTLRSAFNGTTLMRKVINRSKLKKNTSRSSKIPLGSKLLPSTSTSTYLSPLTTSSSSLGSSSTCSDHLSTHETYSPPSISLNNGTGATKCGVQERKRVHHNSTTALYCLFSISLLVLILYGRFPAILYTTVLFYVVRPTSPRKNDFNDLVQNKNKNIMNRKIERSPSDVHLASHGSMSKLTLGGKSFNLR